MRSHLQKAKRFKHISLMLLAFFITTNIQAEDIQFQLDTHIGTDSNPHKLMDAFSPSSDAYIYTDFEFSKKLNKKFSFQADLKNAIYFDDDRADWLKAKLELAYKSKFKSKKKRSAYEASLDYSMKDRTYVSRNTGQEATFGGQLVGDRYDSNIINLNGVFSHKRKKSKMGFEYAYQFRTKSYEDFSSIGLSNLDYNHHKLSAKMDYKISKSKNLFTKLGFIMRDYDDRRATSLLGARIANSDLGYDYINLKVGFENKPSKKNSWSYTLKYSDRSDNAEGYADLTTTSFAVATKYKLPKKAVLKASLKYSSLDYDNQVDFNLLSLTDESKERNGFSLKLDYQWVLTRWYKKDLKGYVSVDLYDFDSSNVNYEYSRNIIAAGVRWAAF